MVKAQSSKSMMFLAGFLYVIRRTASSASWVFLGRRLPSIDLTCQTTKLTATMVESILPVRSTPLRSTRRGISRSRSPSPDKNVMGLMKVSKCILIAVGSTYFSSTCMNISFTHLILFYCQICMMQ